MVFHFCAVHFLDIWDGGDLKSATTAPAAALADWCTGMQTNTGIAIVGNHLVARLINPKGERFMGTWIGVTFFYIMSLLMPLRGIGAVMIALVLSAVQCWSLTTAAVEQLLSYQPRHCLDRVSCPESATEHWHSCNATGANCMGDFLGTVNGESIADLCACGRSGPPELVAITRQRSAFLLGRLVGLSTPVPSYMLNNGADSNLLPISATTTLNHHLVAAILIIRNHRCVQCRLVGLPTPATVKQFSRARSQVLAPGLRKLQLGIVNFISSRSLRLSYISRLSRGSLLQIRGRRRSSSTSVELWSQQWDEA